MLTIHMTCPCFSVLQVLAGDRRLGLRSRCIDEPMDTIFIKHVRPQSPASAAGLMPGDRVVSVNGQTIADLPYAEVVQLIQNSSAYLHLLVVPKENDLLQLVSSRLIILIQTDR